MSEQQIERAVQRIEAALGRIASLADRPAPSEDTQSAALAALVERHEALREATETALRSLDRLIEEIEL